VTAFYVDALFYLRLRRFFVVFGRSLYSAEPLSSLGVGYRGYCDLCTAARFVIPAKAGIHGKLSEINHLEHFSSSTMHFRPSGARSILSLSKGRNDEDEVVQRSLRNQIVIREQRREK
jgi:hypothetical protein